MFDKDAIAALTQAQSIAAAESAITNQVETLVGLPETFKLHDLEPYLKLRRRLRGTMSTISIDDFATYTRANKQTGAAVFVGAAQMQAIAVLNLGTPEEPGHADNRSVLTVPKTAAFAALLGIANGGAKTQAAVAEFLEDWAAQIACYNEAGEPVATKHAVAAVRKISIEGTKRSEAAEQTLSASRSTFEQVKATGTETLPVLICMTCEPYKGLPLRTFLARLGIITGDKPTLVLRIVKLETHVEEMAGELAGLVSLSLAGDDVPVLLGDYSAKA
jgi:uncharacterized protein YfdQ (DUF2303 family)